MFHYILFVAKKGFDIYFLEEKKAKTTSKSRFHLKKTKKAPAQIHSSKILLYRVSNQSPYFNSKCYNFSPVKKYINGSGSIWETLFETVL